MGNAEGLFEVELDLHVLLVKACDVPVSQALVSKVVVRIGSVKRNNFKLKELVIESCEVGGSNHFF